MTEQIEYILPVFSASNVLFSYYMESSWTDEKTIISFIGFGLGLIHAFLPMERFNEYIFRLESQNNTETFNDLRLKFFTDYDRENPVSEKIAKENHLDAKLH